MTESTTASKRAQAATAALIVLAAQGSRGLTHRAVDQAAGLPPGSTSNYFRTRSALLEAAQRRHVELDLPPAELVATMDGIALDQLMEPDSSLDRAGMEELLERLLDNC